MTSREKTPHEIMQSARDQFRTEYDALPTPIALTPEFKVFITKWKSLALFEIGSLSVLNRDEEWIAGMQCVRAKLG